MNPKHEIKILENPNLLPEHLRVVNEFQKIICLTRKHLKKVEKRGHIGEKNIERSIKARKEGNDLYTKKGHNSQVHSTILKCYSKSIMFAPMGSEELALGYGNRSALLIHLRLYEESLVDIDRALQLSNSDEYKKKLQARKEKCLELINEQSLKSIKISEQIGGEDLDKLASKLKNFKPSVTIPCAADCVGLAYNNKFGRHLVATRDIEPGEILILEKGSACYPLLDEINVVCSHCLQYAWNGIPCDECIYAIYCSEACKNEAHNEYHDIECPIAKYMDYTVLNTESDGSDRMLNIRLLIKAVKKQGHDNVFEEILKSGSKDNLDAILTDGILQSEKFNSYYNLLTDCKQIESDEQLDFHSVQILYLLLEHTDLPVLFRGEKPGERASQLKAFLPGATVMVDYTFAMDPSILLALQAAISKLKRISVTNQYLFRNGPWQCDCNNNVLECSKKCNLVRGNVMVPCCALLNHSCTPNVRHLCAPKREIIVFSTCPIKKGEMLCDSYRGICILYGDLKSRQSDLKLDCKCKACVDKINVDLYNYEKKMNKIWDELTRQFPMTLTDLCFEKSVENFEASEEIFQDMIKISKLLYKQFNYYEAYMYNSTCKAYIECMMSKFFKEKKSTMPDTC